VRSPTEEAARTNEISSQAPVSVGGRWASAETMSLHERAGLRGTGIPIQQPLPDNRE
jgi:hypothetical protein